MCVSMQFTVVHSQRSVLCDSGSNLYLEIEGFLFFFVFSFLLPVFIFSLHFGCEPAQFAAEGLRVILLSRPGLTQPSNHRPTVKRTLQIGRAFQDLKEDQFRASTRGHNEKKVKYNII